MGIYGNGVEHRKYRNQYEIRPRFQEYYPIYIHILNHIRKCHTHTQSHTHTHAHTHIYIYIIIYKSHTHTQIYIHIKSYQKMSHTHNHTHTHAHTHIYIYNYIQITHTHIYIYTHTYGQVPEAWLFHPGNKRGWKMPQLNEHVNGKHL